MTNLITNVPSIEWTDAGLTIPSQAEVLSGVLADFNEAFGGNLNITNLETPQGQLASSLAAIISAKNDDIAMLVNQVNPDYASGVMQDAIGKIYYLSRKAATDSTVVCTFNGLQNTVIPKGFVVLDSNKNKWALQTALTIDSSGVATGTLTCSGKVSAAAGTVSTVYQAVVGLDSVTNPQDAVPGALIESRTAFRDRRLASVAINSNNTVQAVYGAVFDVSGVSDVFVTDNKTDVSLNYGTTNYTLLPHSIYVAAIGGRDSDVAKAIWDKVGVGCNFNGNTTVTVYDDSYSDPMPSYEIKFVRPTATAIYFNVKIKRTSLLPTDTVSLIQNAIISRFNGEDGSNQERIGGAIYASRYYCSVLSAISNLDLLGITVGTDSSAMGAEVDLGVDQYPAISAININVEIV